MSDDQKELIEYLDQKFVSIDKRFDLVDEKFKTVDKRFDLVDEKFEAIEEQFVEIKDEFNKLYTNLDSYAKRADTYFQEMVMLSHKVDRHEKWLKQIAEKVGIKLDS